MTFRELFDKEEFCEIFSEVEKFSHDKLDRYIQRLQQQKMFSGSKEIFDAVWGNLYFRFSFITTLEKN